MTKIFKLQYCFSEYIPPFQNGENMSYSDNTCPHCGTTMDRDWHVKRGHRDMWNSSSLWLYQIHWWLMVLAKGSALYPRFFPAMVPHLLWKHNCCECHQIYEPKTYRAKLIITSEDYAQHIFLTKTRVRETLYFSTCADSSIKTIKYIYIYIYLVSHVRCQVSHITCHVSHRSELSSPPGLRILEE